MNESKRGLSRRRLLALTGACGAGLLFDRARLFAFETELVAEEPWAGIAKLAPNVWAVASTPVKSSDWTTGCNGGIVAGSDRVLAVESFLRPEGARWVARIARELTGRRPTDVLITHFHGDHSNGLQGYAEGGERPRVWMTLKTRALIREADGAREDGVDEARREMLEESSIVSPEGVTEIDLGGRAVELHPRRGHTPSDVTVELAEPSVVFFGDLLWNGFFPNYRDTIPTPFAESIRATRRDRDTIYVPGHGALADHRAVDLCLTLVESVEAAARDAFERGVSAGDAAKEFRLPEVVSDWILFNERYFEVAITSWYKELGK
jgi:glyoxylase-like metal-dependent hydrolase (beta-lactamase superfamily II)